MGKGQTVRIDVNSYHRCYSTCRSGGRNYSGNLGNSYHRCYLTNWVLLTTSPTIGPQPSAGTVFNYICKSTLITVSNSLPTHIFVLLLNVYGELDAHKKTKCKLISALLVEKRTVHVNYRSTHIIIVTYDNKS